ncbi:MAG: ANTAR domain-containing protein [Peptococcaceae bacterium]|jgi:response regulator NasT|nr:ANTAR domain-containing protein [Peptococcaceae bacterium]
MYSSTVVLASRDPLLRKTIKGILLTTDRTVVGEAEDQVTALKMIRIRQPDLVIVDEDLKNSSGLEVATIAGQDRLAPVVYVTTYPGHAPADALKELWIFGLVPKPVDEVYLLLSIEMAEAGFHKLREMEKEIAQLKETLQSRKAVERAKGILMETMGISEAEAFKRIQKQSMDRRTSMRVVADAIIMAHDLQAGAMVRKKS